ncbi:hypothetical protein ACS0TY_006364 [Phlomoides rotata]
MEICSAPISRCSKEHQKIYQEWFSIADSVLWNQMEMGVLVEVMLPNSFLCLTFLAKISNSYCQSELFDDALALLGPIFCLVLLGFYYYKRIHLCPSRLDHLLHGNRGSLETDV